MGDCAEIKQQLKPIVGEKWFLDSPSELYAYSYDATPMYQALPDAVIMPASTREVSEILKIANRHKIPIIPGAPAPIWRPAPSRFKAASS